MIKMKTPYFSFGLWFAICLYQCIFIFNFNTVLSPIADPYSEANALRAALSYNQKGFSRSFGLPHIHFKGITFHKFNEVNEEDIPYLHYPPGPDLITGVLMLIFGKNHIVYYRLFPISLGLICGLFFFYGLSLWFKGWNLYISSILLSLSPISYNMMHGLHYQGYAQSLLMLSLGLFMIQIKSDHYKPIKYGFIYFVIGMLQGWLSFDYFFIIFLFPVPFIFIHNRNKNHILNYFLVIVVSLLGFILSHLLHFLQVVSFYKSINLAIYDFFTSAVNRGSVLNYSMAQLLYDYVWIYPKYKKRNILIS